MRKLDGKIRAVVYARFVAQRANVGENAEQYKHCINYIEAKGYELAGVYTDETASGLHTDHPAINDLRADAAAGKFDSVVVFDLSRIARDARAVRSFLDDMQRCDVNVESVKESKGVSLLCQLVRIK